MKVNNLLVLKYLAAVGFLIGTAGFAYSVYFTWSMNKTEFMGVNNVLCWNALLSSFVLVVVSSSKMHFETNARMRYFCFALYLMLLGTYLNLYFAIWDLYSAISTLNCAS